MLNVVLILLAGNGLGLGDGGAIEFLQPNPCTNAKLKN